MMAASEEISKAVLAALPGLTPDTLETLMTGLKRLGVQSREDLCFLTEEDLQNYLPTIQCRRLIHSFPPKDSKRPPGSSSQMDMEVPKEDKRIQSANTIKNDQDVFTPLSSDSKRPPGSSSQMDMEVPKEDKRIQSANTIKNDQDVFTPLSSDSKRPPGSSSQINIEVPKEDKRMQRANKIKNGQEIFTLLPSGNPAIYKLNLKSTGNYQVCIKEFGRPVLGKPNKTIMLLGATGSGKTTLINGMINYILGVEWEDEWRFKLIDEVTNKTQAESQTSEVTAYRIHHDKDFQVPYSLTIIDTPGFGDTRGIKHDKEITEKIRQFFTQQDGIATIDAVCFVVQSALARLTHTQKYIFEAVLSIFGKDIASNIMYMITFADGQKPPVLQAIRAAGIPCATKTDGSFLHFKFNNSALYAPNKQADDEEDSFDQMFWKMGEGSMKRFFNNLKTMETQSLKLTKEVLTERKQLEATVAGVQPLIQKGLSKLNEIKDTRAALQQHQSAIDANKDFTYELEIPVIKEEKLEAGVYVTNCLKCNYTCHDNCAYADDADKIKCSAMKDSFCTVCPQNCKWDMHRNMPFKFVTEMTTETRTYENLKKQYEDAQGEKMTAEQIIKELEQEYEKVQLDVFQKTDNMAKNLNRLQEIALRPDPLSTPGYIELLIESEKQECKPGYQKRMAELQTLLDQAVIMNKVAKGEPLTAREYKMQNPNFVSRATNWAVAQFKKLK